MMRFFRFSPARLALSYILLGAAVLALFAVPLWYAWSVNVGTFREYVGGDELAKLTETFERQGARGLAALMEARGSDPAGGMVTILADASKSRLAGNLPAWPEQVPDAAGTYGLVIGIGGDATMRVVATHVRLPGGYRLLVGRESARFQSLVELFWYGIAGAMGVVLVLGAVLGWAFRRALLSEVHEVSRAAAAVVAGDPKRRLPTHGVSMEFDALARTVNEMLEQLSAQNLRLEGEIAVRRRAEEALHRAHDDLEGLVAQRTAELADANALLDGEKQSLELIARDSPLALTLDALCRRMEEMFDGSLCSILLLNAQADRLSHGAAPSLPAGYTGAVDGWPLSAGPCGLAASAGHPVISADITADGRWSDDYKALSATYGLRSCWSTPIVSSEGKVLGTFAILSREPGEPMPWHRSTVDRITHIASIAIERTLAEEELRRQKAHLDELFDLAPDAVVLTTIRDPRNLRINKEFTRMFGYTAEEAVGRRMRELIAPPELKPANLTENADLLAGRTVEMEVVRQRKDGTRFDAHVTAKRVRIGDNEDAAFVIYRDITGRKQAEESLRLSEGRYARAMEATDAGHWEWDLRTDEVFHSARFRELHGIAADERFTRRDEWKARQYYLPGERERQDQAIRGAISGPTNRYEVDVRIAPPPGHVRWLRSRGKLFRDEAGRPALMAGTSMDVTEYKLAEEALRLAERQRRQAQRLEAMGTLAGGIAHDFNNILGAILGYGEMALRDAPPGARLRRDLDNILAAGERGRTLIDRILTFSRSGVGERVPVHVERVVREAVDLLGPKLPAGIAIEARLKAGRAAMLGEGTQVHQVLTNLATNAIQAMPEGGTLRVALRAQSAGAERAATIGTVAAGDYIVLEVADSGTGIAPEILDRIFDPFFTTKEVNVGTGLGLSLVHGIVSEVGGAIDVATTPGAGSVFTVYFPRAGDAPGDREDVERRLPQGGGQRVLVVDDEEPLVRLATETLDELGYAAVGFTSSAAALDAFRADPDGFDALITDERMPGMAGSALIREVRRLRSAIPILLVSGYVGGMVMGRAYNEGADEVLKKPLSAHDLATSLARVLRR